MKSKHSGMYFSNLEWLKDVFQNEDVILADVSALEVLGLFSGYVNEEKIYVYAKKKGIYDNVDYRIIDDFDSVGYVIKSGIKCTSINQTFNDMLRNTDDMQALIEGASSSELKTLLEQNNLEIKYMSATKEMLPTLFDYQPPNSKEKIHQSQKPVDLIKKIISLITEAGEWVLDQFGGSFVTSCAAIETGRNSIVYELDEEVFNKGLNHLNKMGYAQEILIA